MLYNVGELLWLIDFLGGAEALQSGKKFLHKWLKQVDKLMEKNNNANPPVSLHKKLWAAPQTHALHIRLNLEN